MNNCWYKSAMLSCALFLATPNLSRAGISADHVTYKYTTFCELYAEARISKAEELVFEHGPPSDPTSTHSRMLKLGLQGFAGYGSLRQEDDGSDSLYGLYFKTKVRMDGRDKYKTHAAVKKLIKQHNKLRKQISKCVPDDYMPVQAVPNASYIAKETWWLPEHGIGDRRMMAVRLQLNLIENPADESLYYRGDIKVTINFTVPPNLELERYTIGR